MESDQVLKELCQSIIHIKPSKLRISTDLWIFPHKQSTLQLRLKRNIFTWQQLANTHPRPVRANGLSIRGYLPFGTFDDWVIVWQPCNFTTKVGG